MITADVLIIGAGVVGCALARQLSRYELKILLLEAEDDVGTGALGQRISDLSATVPSATDRSEI